MSTAERSQFSRRDVMKTGAALAAVAAAGSLPRAYGVTGAGPRLKVGVIGCGGRGTGAAVNILESSADVEIWALGDLFKDRLDGSLSELQKHDAERTKVPADRVFAGFDAYKKVIASGVDVVILAS
ncbi:MAG: twin-arginine translocation signal domain-containing protein, partial [Phycisphaerales bacterium]